MFGNISIWSLKSVYPEPDKKPCFVHPEVKRCMALQNLEIYGILPAVQHMKMLVPCYAVWAYLYSSSPTSTATMIP
jgi:hypothetical protein